MRLNDPSSYPTPPKITSGGSYFPYLLSSSSETTSNQVYLTKLELLIASFSGGSPRDTMGASGGRHASTFCQTHNDVCLSFSFLSLCLAVCLLACFTFYSRTAFFCLNTNHTASSMDANFQVDTSFF